MYLYRFNLETFIELYEYLCNWAKAFFWLEIGTLMKTNLWLLNTLEIGSFNELKPPILLTNLTNFTQDKCSGIKNNRN